MRDATHGVENTRLASNCYLCKLPALDTLLDLGPQPISTHFLVSVNDENPVYPMHIAVCKNCGLVQLVNPAPVALLRPQVDWLTYNEPEAHLDSLVGEITRLPGISSQSVIAGVSFKEDTTLNRLNRLGYANTWRIEPVADLDTDVNWVGVETIQDQLTLERSRAIATRRGLADVVIARHILEHAQHPTLFLEALQQLVRPEGYLVIEVPDCSRALADLDYTTLWEEHTQYFTPLTFEHMCSISGLPLVFSAVYPFSFENSLVAILRVHGATDKHIDTTHNRQNQVDLEIAQAFRFAQALPEVRKAFASFLRQVAKDSQSTAMFGAGHLTLTFLSLMEAESAVGYIIDDNPHKQNMLMPGSYAPIVSSAILGDADISMCLLGINPMSESKVVEKNAFFRQKGGSFYSIFASSPLYWRKEVAL